MNAYELADLMTSCPVKCYTQGDTKVDFHEIANMLRQQADELEAFKLNFYNTGYALQLRDKDETIRQQADRIAELSKNVDELEEELLKTTNPSAEPVAWMEIEYGGFTEYKVWREPVSSKSIPLYTHPAKTLTLTPDEIFDIWDEHTDYDGNFISDIDTFVLAILRKAQEK